MTDDIVMQPPATVSASVRARLVPAVVALLLGGFLIVGVGFARIDAVHNAAHDGRHSFAFPCH